LLRYSQLHIEAPTTANGQAGHPPTWAPLIMTSKLCALSLGCVAAALSWSAQAAVVNLNFETIGLAAPSTGTAVGNAFSSAGLSFSANAFAFHNGVNESPSRNDRQTQISTRSGNFGYVRGQNSALTDFADFTIFVTGKNYVQFALNIAAPIQPSEILVFGTGNVQLRQTKTLFSNAGGWAWTTAPFELLDSMNQTPIDHITFTTGISGFAIDDLQFTEAGGGGGGGGGTVPEPAGLGLVALALAAAGLASRRRKSA
jgi:hypothetical protein